MFEYIATLVGMHETDKILMAEAQAKESNKTVIVQMATPNLSSPCYYKDHKKIMIADENSVKDMVDWFRRGNAKEAMIIFERIYPEMRGISDRVV
jgi:hypothetical protein